MWIGKDSENRIRRSFVSASEEVFIPNPGVAQKYPDWFRHVNSDDGDVERQKMRQPPEMMPLPLFIATTRSRKLTEPLGRVSGSADAVVGKNGSSLPPHRESFAMNDYLHQMRNMLLPRLLSGQVELAKSSREGVNL